MSDFADTPLPAAGSGELEQVAAALGDLAVHDMPLGERTTYRAGGAAAVGVMPRDDEDLARVAEALAGTEVPVLVMGRGSNLLVADAGFAGVAVIMDAQRWGEITIDGTEVNAGGAAMLPVVARRTAAAGLTGFEWAVGVPGSIGGAVRMNAGGHGSDMRASLVRVRLFSFRTGEDGEVPATALDLGYRTSSVAADEVVLRADLALALGEPSESLAELEQVVVWRREHQPGGSNAGSVFTNPVGDSAGRLIDEAGAKGMRVGTASVSLKHANFIQVDPGGSADDVAELMVRVAEQVSGTIGVDLAPETRLVGFPGTLGGPDEDIGS